jgi:PiT family inorganic phosphate transporter
MHLLAESISFGTGAFLVIALLMALSFEFVNGFHDTANAVATVIYTHTLPPWVAVIWSGCWNLVGVLLSSGGVAFAILALLPVELVVKIGSGPGFAMVFALLISAIIWNLGTWYLGLPASSSHTLIGSIMGVGLANSLMAKGHVFGDGVNWGKVSEVFTSLLVSPIVGFVLSAGLLLLAKALLSKHPALFKAPPKDAPPPKWIRGLLILTCTGVSFAHGSNDGQKGMGLVLLILIGILPATYALNPAIDAAGVDKLQKTAVSLERHMDAHVSANASAALYVPDSNEADDELSAYLKANGKVTDHTFAALAFMNHKLAESINSKPDFQSLSVDERKSLRTTIYLIGATIAKLNKNHEIKDPVEASVMKRYGKQLENVTQFIPTWVKFAVALALGLGTMIGWKRIVVTVGEKIGKDHLTYAQGASAELVAMATILAADRYNLPVSTTHVLSSGVAGTMAANKSGLQMGTLRNLLLAWVLTLPVCVILGAATFAAGLFVVLHDLVYFAIPLLLVAAVAVVLVIRMREQKIKKLSEVVAIGV